MENPKSPKYNFVSYQSTSMIFKSLLEASLLSCTCCHHILPDNCCMQCHATFCVSFLNACYVGFGPVFFCTYKGCKALINLSGSPQGHPQFNILATPCCMHVAHGNRTHTKAFTLLRLYRCTRPVIHSAAIMQSYSSIIRSTHPSSCLQYLSMHQQGQMRQCACALSYARALSCTPVARPSF